MQPQSLDRRVTNLEQNVEKLEGLPDRVTALEVQISEFREAGKVLNQKAEACVNGAIAWSHGGSTKRRRDLKVTSVLHASREPH